MKCEACDSALVEQEVTFPLELGDRWVLIEHVPAQVCLNCGENTLSADTADHLEKTPWLERRPSKLLETPVFEFAAGRIGTRRRG